MTTTHAHGHRAEAGDRPQCIVDPVLLTIADTAAALSIGRTTVYELIAAGDIEVVHIGRSARVPVASISEFVAARRAGG